MKKYEHIEISGDAGLRVWGNSPEKLFEHAGLGMSELITDTSTVQDTAKKEIKLSSDSIENLFIKWLNELIFYFDAHNFVGTSFFVSITDNHLGAEVSGGIFDQAENESRLLLKAATYNSLSIKKTGSIWKATVIFDI